MHKITGLAVSALAFVALSAGAAFAQAPSGAPGGGDPVARLMVMDTNHDGSLSAAEIAAGRQAGFTRMDANHDGFISQDEASQGGGGNVSAMFTQADTNHDGKVSQAEYMAQPSRILQFDTDHDGALSMAEISAMRAAIAARMNGGN